MKISLGEKFMSALLSAPSESHETLLKLSEFIISLAPEAEKCVSYGMPGFTLDGKPFIGFAGYKHHIGFYPMSGSFLKHYEKELKNYETSKGAVRFPLEKPLPLSLIKKMIKGKIHVIRGITLKK